MKRRCASTALPTMPRAAPLPWNASNRTISLLVDLRLRTRLEQRLVEALKAAAPEWLELSLTPEPGPAFSRLDSLQRYVLTGEPAPRRAIPTIRFRSSPPRAKPWSALKSRAVFFACRRRNALR